MFPFNSSLYLLFSADTFASQLWIPLDISDVSTGSDEPLRETNLIKSLSYLKSPITCSLLGTMHSISFRILPKKNLVKVPVINHTIPHQTSARYGGADIFLRPASHGTGLIAGGAVRAVLESAGVHDVLSKSKGSSNPHNVVKATFNALLDIRRPEEIARMRGVSLSKVFNG